MNAARDAAATPREQFRALLSCVPPGWTADEALEARMALMRECEAKASRGLYAGVWIAAVLVDLLAWAIALTSGA